MAEFFGTTLTVSSSEQENKSWTINGQTFLTYFIVITASVLIMLVFTIFGLRAKSRRRKRELGQAIEMAVNGE